MIWFTSRDNSESDTAPHDNPDKVLLVEVRTQTLIGAVYCYAEEVVDQPHDEEPEVVSYFHLPKEERRREMRGRKRNENGTKERKNLFSFSFLCFVVLKNDVIFRKLDFNFKFHIHYTHIRIKYAFEN